MSGTPERLRGLVLGAASTVGARIVERLLGAGLEVVGRDDLVAGDLVHLERASGDGRFRFELDAPRLPLPEGCGHAVDLTEVGGGAARVPEAAARHAERLLAHARAGHVVVFVTRDPGASLVARRLREARGNEDVRLVHVAATHEFDRDDGPGATALVEALVHCTLGGVRGGDVLLGPNAAATSSATAGSEVLARAAAAVAAAAEAHRLGDAMVAAERLISVSEFFEALHRWLETNATADAAALDAELARVVAAIGEAQLRRDPVGIADLLEYEALPLLARRADRPRSAG